MTVRPVFKGMISIGAAAQNQLDPSFLKQKFSTGASMPQSLTIPAFVVNRISMVSCAAAEMPCGCYDGEEDEE